MDTQSEVPQGRRRWNRLQWLAGVFGIVTVALFVSLQLLQQTTTSSPTANKKYESHDRKRRRITELRRVPVYSSLVQDSPIARKQLHDLRQTLESDLMYFEPISLSFDQQRFFLQDNSRVCGTNAAERFDAFLELEQEDLAVEVFKWCALASNQEEAAVYLDSTGPLMMRLQHLIQDLSNSIVVLGDENYFSSTMHSSFVLLRKEHAFVAKEMLRFLIETPLDSLQVSPLLIPKTLYALVAAQVQKDGQESAQSKSSLKPGLYPNSWKLLQHSCRMDPLRRMEKASSDTKDMNSHRLVHKCPENSGFCCTIHDVTAGEVVLMNHHPIVPDQTLVRDLPQAYNAAVGVDSEEAPYIATLREEIVPRPNDDWPETPNFYDMLSDQNCLPADDTCSKCLREKKGANCHVCAKQCTCYCQALCQQVPKPKFVSKKWYVSPPLYTRDSNRIIPRIVHQTWFEELDQEQYPNMSRLVESFKTSGWEYKFYSDEAAAAFLTTHFPEEVRQAYDALLPGAFKADLFRYCVLLIHGGVYADVDIQLESTLDFSIPPDVGFMVPVDEPGKPVNRQMCLWNGFIAAAPGHPILAKAIETVVNQVRNRFTSVDVDATFCPDPELSVTHAYDTLFTAGPCLLGATVNRVYGRHGQTSFAAGELNPWDNEQQRQLAIPGTSFVLGADSEPSLRIPGRTVILRQNKWDMGAHRFTLLERNLVVAATDLPDSNDRENLEAASGNTEHEHYSKTHAKVGIYGLEGLYADSDKANEDIRIFVNNEKHAKKVLPKVS